MQRRRNQPPIKFTLRFYPGQDDDLLRWLDELDAVQFGAKTQALKKALRAALGSSPCQATPNAPILDLAEVRRVVEAGVASALGRLEGQVLASPKAALPEEDDDEIEDLMAALQRSLVLG
jgi:hypothetical protein